MKFGAMPPRRPTFGVKLGNLEMSSSGTIAACYIGETIFHKPQGD